MAMSEDLWRPEFQLHDWHNSFNWNNSALLLGTAKTPSDRLDLSLSTTYGRECDKLFMTKNRPEEQKLITTEPSR